MEKKKKKFGNLGTYDKFRPSTPVTDKFSTPPGSPPTLTIPVYSYNANFKHPGLCTRGLSLGLDEGQARNIRELTSQGLPTRNVCF